VKGRKINSINKANEIVVGFFFFHDTTMERNSTRVFPSVKLWILSRLSLNILRTITPSYYLSVILKTRSIRRKHPTES
jgi:hypothetical protein